MKNFNKKNEELVDFESLNSDIVEELENKNKGYLTNIKCPDCGARMVVRENKKDGNKFLGCYNFPQCKSTLSFTTYKVGGGGMENLASISRIINKDWFGNMGRYNCESFGFDYGGDNYWGTNGQIHCHDDM